MAPGFAGTDASMAVLRAWFRRLGYRPIGADLRWNVGCSTELVDRLERRVEAHVAATGGPVVLLGHGVLAEAHARIADTINYELVCGIQSDPLRARRTVIDA